MRGGPAFGNQLYVTFDILEDKESLFSNGSKLFSLYDFFNQSAGNCFPIGNILHIVWEKRLVRALLFDVCIFVNLKLSMCSHARTVSIMSKH